MNDIRYAIRGLLTRPGFSVVAILTLALGIGANTAIFSVVNGVVLRPLSYPEPERVFFITSQFKGMFDQFWVSVPEFIEFRDRNKAFASVGAYTVGAANLGTETPSRPVTAAVTHDLMTTLGVQPIRGRAFTREDTLPNTEEVAILSYELWRSSFAENPEAVGRIIDVGGARTRIVGVMPAGYDIHDQKVELWRPLRIDPANPGNRGGHFLYLVGRLKPGLTLEQARADLETQLSNWHELASAGKHAPSTTDHRFRIDPLKDDMVGDVKQAVWVLQGAVAFVLLIACANLANLLLARAESRQREFAVRTAMGASRGRMLRQFITEGIVLSVLGGALGVWLAGTGMSALLAANPESIPRSADITLDTPVLLFTLALAVVTGVLFGVAPLLHLSQRSMNIALREGGSRTTAGTGKARMRSVLVVAEVALAVVLVVGAGLLLRSFWNLTAVDAGFNRNNLTTFRLALPNAQFPESARRASFYRELIDKIRAVPGVQAAAAMSGLPPSRQVNANDTEFIGVPGPPAGPNHNVDFYQFVTASYLSTMGIPIVEGRGFLESDFGGGGVVLINEKYRSEVLCGAKPHRPRPQALHGNSTAAHDRRGRQGRETAWCRRGNRHGNLSPLRTAPGTGRPGAWRDERRGSIRDAVRDHCSDADADRPLDGSAAARRRYAADARRVRRIDCAPPISSTAPRGLCRSCPSARRGRNLRGPFISGERAASGDRHPHGAWRRAP